MSTFKIVIDIILLIYVVYLAIVFHIAVYNDNKKLRNILKEVLEQNELLITQNNLLKDMKFKKAGKKYE